MEGAGSVQDDLQARDLDYLVKGILLGDVWDNHNLEAVGLVLVGIANLLGFVLGADSGDDGVALFEELLKDMGYRRVLAK
jgi:hypothetical protein